MLVPRRAVTSGSPIASGHVKALDGVRGVAFIAVLLFHLKNTVPLGKPGLLEPVLYLSGYGYLGVDIFFVLSGFLITAILLKSRRSENYFRVFYIRRTLRIFPLYYVAVTYVVVTGSFRFRYQFWYWINASNILTAFHPFALPALTHFWSLAIEEQFYLLWPLLVWKLPKRALILLCAVMLPLQYVLTILPATLRMDSSYSNFSYRLTPFHSAGLFLGSVLAIWMADHVLQLRHLRFLRVIALACLPLLGLVFHKPYIGGVWLRHADVPVASVFAAAVIALVTLNRQGWLSRGLTFRPLALVGRYSFCMYVVHLEVLRRVYQFSPSSLRASPWGFLLVGIESFALTFIVAAISWRLLEEPILCLKRHFMYQTSAVA